MTAIPVMRDESGCSRDFEIAQGALSGNIHAISKSRLQIGNCCVYDSKGAASLPFMTAIPVMRDESGCSRDFEIAQGALSGNIHAISSDWNSPQSRLQNGNCCVYDSKGAASLPFMIAGSSSTISPGQLC
jgi:hypothetical protein